MSSSDVTVRHILPADVKAATDLFTEAFTDDPFFYWLCPDPKRRETVIRAWMGISVARGMQRGNTFLAIANSKICGAAIWSPPGIDITSATELLIQQTVANTLAESAPNYRTLAPVSAMQPSVPHYYLRDIGVNKDYRGQGIGGLLLNKVGLVCDAEMLPAYLETTKEANVDYFARFGYESIGQVRITKDLCFMGLMRQPLVK